MRGILKKLVISVIIMGMIVNDTVAFAEQTNGKEESTVCMAIANDCDIIYERYAQSENRSKVKVTIKNDGSKAVSNWRLVYNSSAVIESAEDVEIIMQKDVHELGFTEKNRLIEPACSVSFSIIISHSDNYVSPEKFRVYCEVSQEEMNGTTFDECLDCMSYNADNGKIKLETYDSEDDSGSGVSRSSDLSTDSSIAVEKNSFSNEVSPYGIIGNDNRIKVTDPTVSPYLRIAVLVIKFPNDTYAFGTGTMVSEKYMITAAHNIYNSKKGAAASVDAYFGVNGTNYICNYPASQWHWSSDYKTNPCIQNDWGVIQFKASVGSRTGWSGVGYTTDASLSKMNVTVTGYPGDKKVADPAGIIGYRCYMYRCSSSVENVYEKYFSYTADTYNGQSGAPVYNSSTNIVYGIHAGEIEGANANACHRITKSLFNSWVDKGWINK